MPKKKQISVTIKHIGDIITVFNYSEAIKKRSPMYKQRRAWRDQHLRSMNATEEPGDPFRAAIAFHKDWGGKTGIEVKQVTVIGERVRHYKMRKDDYKSLVKNHGRGPWLGWWKYYIIGGVLTVDFLGNEEKRTTTV